MRPVEVPAGKYWAAQSQRSLKNFKIGDQKMTLEIIYAFVYFENLSMLVTTLNINICYEKIAEIVKKALAENTTLVKAAIELGYVTEEQFDRW